MKFYTFQCEKGADRLGIGYDDRPDKIYPQEAFGLHYCDMTTLIREIELADMDMLRHREVVDKDAALYSFDDIILRSPIPFPAQDVICLGINYDDHAVEASRFDEKAFRTKREEAAIYFSKRVNESTGDGDAIPLYEGLVDGLDYETELGVIIGRDAFCVPEDEVYSYIFGYTIVNDVSARNLQTSHKQWYFGKSLDGFTPMGPCILTADACSWPPELDIRCAVNDELRQNSNTRNLIHGIAEIVSELSQGMLLKAGTIIATGTPSGVGMGMQPPSFLHRGDTVRCEIEMIGTLTNHVK